MLAMTIFAALTSAAAGLPSVPVVRRDVEVSIADLDLTDARQVKELDRRLRKAAARACGSVDGTDPSAWAHYKDCFGDALMRARAEAQTRLSRSRS